MLLHRRWMMRILVGIVMIQATPTSASQPPDVLYLDFTDIGTTTATVLWERPAGYPQEYDQFLVKIDPEADIAPNPIPGGTYFTKLQGLIPGRYYTVEVRTERREPYSAGNMKKAVLSTKPNKPKSISVKDNKEESLIVVFVAGDGNQDSIDLEYNVFGQAAKTSLKGVTSPKTVGSLTAGTKYEIYVYSIAGTVKSDPTSVTAFTAPKGVTGVQVKAGTTTTTTLTVEFTKATSDAATFYTLAMTGGTLAKTKILQSGTPEVGVTGLTAGTEYTLSVTSELGGLKSAAVTTKVSTKPQKVAAITEKSSSDTTIDIEWAAVTDGEIDEYNVALNPAAGNLATAVTVAKDKTTFQATGLTGGTDYEFSMITKLGALSSDVTKKSIQTKPSAVDKSKVTFATYTTVGVTMTFDKPPSGLFDGYTITVSNSGSAAAVADINSPSTVITGCPPCTDVTVTITVKKGTKTSVAITVKFKTLPAPVTDLATDHVKTTEISLKWTKPASGGSEGYTVKRDFTVLTVNGLTAFDTGLTAGTKYTYTITNDCGGKSSTVQTVKFYTLPNAPGKITPFSITKTTLTMTWVAATGSFSSYKFKYEKLSDNTMSAVVDNAKAVTKDLTGLTVGTKYKFYVWTVVTANGAEKAKSAETTLDFNTKPDAVLQGSIQTTAYKLTYKAAEVTWTPIPASKGDCDEYLLKLTPAPTPPSGIPTSVAKGNPMVAAISGLTSGTTYTFRVKCKLGLLEGDGVTFQFTTKPPQVDKASIKTKDTTLSDTGLTITWTVPPGTFNEIRATLKSGGTVVSTYPKALGNTVAELVITGLTGGTFYTFEIITRSNVVESPVSEYTFLTNPSAVTGTVSVTNVEMTSVTLSFGKVAGVATGYDVTLNKAGTVGTFADLNSPSVTLTGLIAGTSYTATIKSKAGNPVQFSDAVTKDFDTKPGPVKNPQQGATSINEITISWTAPEGGTSSYKLSMTPMTGGATIETGITATTARATKLTQGTQYTVEIINVYNGADSEKVTITITSLPKGVTGVQVKPGTRTTTSLTVVFTKARTTSSSADTFYTLSMTGGTLAKTKVLQAEIPEVGVTGLTAGTEYTLSVIAELGGLKSAAVTTKVSTKPDKIPEDKIKLDSDAAKLTTVKGTVVYEFPAKGSVTECKLTITGTTGTPAITGTVKSPTKSADATNLLAGIQYTVQITSFFNGNAGAASSFKFYARPNVPGSFTIGAATENSIATSWTNPSGASGSSFDGFRVISKLMDGAKVEKTETKQLGKVTSFLVGNLETGRQYDISLEARAGSASSYSSPPMKKTAHTRPAPVTDLRIMSATTTSLSVKWMKPGGGHTSYKLTTIPTGTVTVTGETGVVTGLTAGTSYTISVTNVWNGVDSETKQYTGSTLTPRPPDVPYLKFTDIGTTTATVTWGQPAGYPQQYDHYLVKIFPYSHNITIVPNPIPGSTDYTKVQGLMPGRYYTVEVRTERREPPTEGNMKKAVLSTRPAPVTDLRKVSATTTSLSLKWTKPGGGHTSYKLTTIPTGTVTVTGETGVVTGLTAGTSYTISVTNVWNGVDSETTQYTGSTLTLEVTAQPAGKPDVGAIAGGTVAAVVMVIAIVVVVVVVIKKRKQDGAGDGTSPGVGGGHEEAENPGLFEIYDEIIPLPEREPGSPLMDVVDRLLPDIGHEDRTSLREVLASLGVKKIKHLLYVKENELIPPLTIIEARMFVEKVQEEDRHGGLDEGVYVEADYLQPGVHSDHNYVNQPRPDYVNVPGHNADAAANNDDLNAYAALEGHVQPAPSTYAALGGIHRR